MRPLPQTDGCARPCRRTGALPRTPKYFDNNEAWGAATGVTLRDQTHMGPTR